MNACLVIFNFYVSCPVPCGCRSGAHSSIILNWLWRVGGGKGRAILLCSFCSLLWRPRDPQGFPVISTYPYLQLTRPSPCVSECPGTDPQLQWSDVSWSWWLFTHLIEWHANLVLRLLHQSLSENLWTAAL